MASAGESGALAACFGNSSLMVFHSTVLMQIGAPVNTLSFITVAANMPGCSIAFIEWASGHGCVMSDLSASHVEQASF